MIAWFLFYHNIIVMLFVLSLSLFFVALSHQAHAQPVATVKLSLSGISQPGAPVHVGVFNTASAFPKRALALTGKVYPVHRSGPLEIDIKLPYGTYALAIFQDLNGNGKMDTNILGVPTEPYGFSGDARSKWRSPSFEEAAFELGEKGKRLNLTLAKWTDQ